MTLSTLNIVIDHGIMFKLFLSCFGQRCESEGSSQVTATANEPNVIVCDAVPAPDQQQLLPPDAIITGFGIFELPLLVDVNNNRFQAGGSDSSLIVMRGSSPDVSDFEEIGDFDDSTIFELYPDPELSESVENWDDGDVIVGEAEVDLDAEVEVSSEEEDTDAKQYYEKVLEIGFGLKNQLNYCGFETPEEEVVNKETRELVNDGDVLISRGGSLRESE